MSSFGDYLALTIRAVAVVATLASTLAAAAETVERGPGLREPVDMAEALNRAEAQALRLREGNNAAVVVLQTSNAMIAFGVLVLVVGVVVLLA